MLVENYTDLKIIQTKEDNLVLVDGGKYILNWAPSEMLNTHSTPITTVKNAVDSSELESFLQ
jgi:ADP-glucose pyrophosphorylase